MGQAQALRAASLSLGRDRAGQRLYHPANHYEPDANGGCLLYPYLKLDLLAGVYQSHATPAHRPRLLCGDFNAPQHEQENGEIITWGYLKRHGDYTLKYPRQHELELGILRELSAYDLQDVYRRLHGYGEQTQEGWSWCYRNHIRYRFDHLFASHALCPVRVTSTPSVSAVSAIMRLWKRFLSQQAGKRYRRTVITLITAITVMVFADGLRSQSHQRKE